MDSLPFIDVHSQRVTASRDAVWRSLLHMLRGTMGGSGRFAKLLGCEPAEGVSCFEGQLGETVPGFRVIDSNPGHRLALRGRHRFADYLLIFTIDADQIQAHSYSGFPGAQGQLYRAAVIGTGAHRIITRAMLRRVARGAEAR